MFLPRACVGGGIGSVKSNLKPAQKSCHSNETQELIFRGAANSKNNKKGVRGSQKEQLRELEQLESSE